jgi:glyoxylase-like metal-dependent hydrolase (beta-lactamase superfamily II)
VELSGSVARATDAKLAGMLMSEARSEDGLEFPWPVVVPGSHPREIVPGLLWARQALASRLDHVNQWILDDGDAFALIDTGVDRPDTRAWWTETLEHLGKLSRVIVTHHHYDHSGMAGFLCERYDVPLWMTRTEWMAALARTRPWNEDQRRLRRRHFSENGLSPAQTGEIESHFEAFSARLSPVPGAYRRLIAGDAVRIGGRAWTVLIGEGHSP